MIKRILGSLLFATALAGCVSRDTVAPVRAVRAEVQAPEVVERLPLPTPSQANLRQRVTIFVANERCAELEPKDIELTQASPEEAVRAIVRSKGLSGLRLHAPDVKVELRSARVDLKLETGSRRSLQNLSECERLSLLTAITHTLRANARWGIARVIFTERGNLLAMST